RCENPVAEPGYSTFDLSAPIVAGTDTAARSAVDVALTGAAMLLEGERAVYALCRPPGHHAGRDLCGGYCYLNNAAIAAEYLLRTEEGPLSVVHDQLQLTTDNRQPTTDTQHTTRVAVLDIDYHHGNGTQQIF